MASSRPVPNPRQEHSTVAINETLLAVVGGVAPAANGPDTTDLVQLYDIPSNSWRTGSPIPIKLNHPNVAVVNGKMYVLGGLENGPNIAGEPINWIATGRTFVYDASLDSWKELNAMPSGTARGSAVTGVHGEMIYVAGGMTVLRQPYQDSVTLTTAFNTSSGEWQRLPPAAANIPDGRQHATGSVVGDTLYVIGGRWFSQRAVRGTVFSLDLNNQTAGWRTDPNLMPVARGGLSGDAVGSKFYTFGGEGNPNGLTGVFNDTAVFDTASRTWSRLAPMAIPRHGMHAVAVGNNIYIPGGGLQQDGKAVTVNGTTRFANTTAYFDAYCAS
ncbi:hypothetical protein HIM_06301 [Hirsutella minnesotensis 3608]|uniref:Galactose oxidase n=1 Tax=Hirsutella minnesotensis 3608 TaxID=1043627 RepID=A0A0F7ZNT2_9HYPO|nr:hypothetical protein HIM_06301 [Hirsutella minnesotensis 3608]